MPTDIDEFASADFISQVALKYAQDHHEPVSAKTLGHQLVQKKDCELAHHAAESAMHLQKVVDKVKEKSPEAAQKVLLALHHIHESSQALRMGGMHSQLAQEHKDRIARQVMLIEDVASEYALDLSEALGQVSRLLGLAASAMRLPSHQGRPQHPGFVDVPSFMMWQKQQEAARLRRETDHAQKGLVNMAALSLTLPKGDKMDHKDWLIVAGVVLLLAAGIYLVLKERKR